MFFKPRSFVVFFLLQFFGNPAFAAVPEAFTDFQKNWLGYSGNFDIGYRQTQFYEGNHNIALGQWDSRIELWLPPNEATKDDKNRVCPGETTSWVKNRPFSWGPYLRIAGIGATSNNTQPNHFDNAWLALPGIGFQVYPFSLAGKCNNLAKFFGPLRLFVEYNQVNYWGSANSWRPNEQLRSGAEYWRSLNVNDNFDEKWWGEFWSGLYYLSANEFATNYNTMVFGASVRAGWRFGTENDNTEKHEKHVNLISMFSPYIAMESSYTGHPSYSWENRLLIGGGIRFTPELDRKSWFNRLVFYAEYDYIPVYYYGYNYIPPSDPAQGPNSHSVHDVRVGINFSVGDWFH